MNIKSKRYETRNNQKEILECTRIYEFIYKN